MADAACKCGDGKFTMFIYSKRYSQSGRPHGSRPFHDLTGTIPLFHRSIPGAINGEWAQGVIPASSFSGNDQ